MHKRMFLSILAMFSALLLPACGTQQYQIKIPFMADIKKITIANGLPGSPSATLTQSQDSNVLAMLKKAQDKGTAKPAVGGYPPILVIHAANGRTLTISPSMDVSKLGNTETGIRVKNYVDVYDSSNQSNVPQRLYSPTLYNYLTKWQQEIPRSQWHMNR